MEVGPCACGAWHSEVSEVEALKKEITRLQKIISDIHFGLTFLCDDATDGQNYASLIATAYTELQELRKFKTNPS